MHIFDLVAVNGPFQISVHETAFEQEPCLHAQLLYGSCDLSRKSLINHSFLFRPNKETMVTSFGTSQDHKTVL